MSLYGVWCQSVMLFFFFKQKTAYEMRISDWSSDVCSSDLLDPVQRRDFGARHINEAVVALQPIDIEYRFKAADDVEIAARIVAPVVDAGRVFQCFANILRATVLDLLDRHDLDGLRNAQDRRVGLGRRRGGDAGHDDFRSAE